MIAEMVRAWRDLDRRVLAEEITTSKAAELFVQEFAAVAASGSPPSPRDAESVAAIARACDMPNETRLTRLAANVVAMRANYARICDALQSCVQRHKLGLGGELIDELVVAEVDRLRASSGSTGAPTELPMHAWARCGQCAKIVHAIIGATPEETQERVRRFTSNA